MRARPCQPIAASFVAVQVTEANASANLENPMKRIACLVALAAASLSGSAFAALTLDRTTTVTDSLGGKLAVTTSGSIELPGADTSSQLALVNFHPHDKANLSVNGSLARTHERSNETVTNTYNGSVTLSGTDKDGKPVNDTLALQNVQVVRDGNGPVFSGTVVLNGTSVDAAHLPDAAKHLLRSVLRVFEFD